MKKLLFLAALMVSTPSFAQKIYFQIKLNFNPGGSGTWILTASSPDSQGVAAARVLIKDVATITNVAPKGTVNTNDGAGFSLFRQSVRVGYTELVWGQVPLVVSGGNTQGTFYRIGVDANATPATAGVPFNNLANVTGSPWGTISFAGSPLDRSTILAVGTFNVGQYPRFHAVGADKTGGNVFAALGTSTRQGLTVEATSITYAGVPGDGDLNGIVEQADYQVWRSRFGSQDPAGDYNRNGEVDTADYTVWRDNLGYNINNL